MNRKARTSSMVPMLVVGAIVYVMIFGVPGSGGGGPLSILFDDYIGQAENMTAPPENMTIHDVTDNITESTGSDYIIEETSGDESIYDLGDLLD